MSRVFELGISSATAITFYPDWAYSAGERVTRSDMRTKSGKLYQYKWNDYNKIKFKVTLVTNSNASIVNSWWDTQTELIWFDTEDGATSITSVMLINKDAPFKQFTKPYTSYKQGIIELEEY